MSKDRQETIADIVAQMRHDIADGTVGIWSDFGGEIARLYADRVDAAHKREIADEKRISDAVIKSLRDKKLEMAGEIAAKDAEIARLRALVKGLLDASSISCADCKYDCYSDHSNCIIHDAANYIKEIEVKNGER